MKASFCGPFFKYYLGEIHVTIYSDDEEQAAEAKILRDFDKSEKLLNLRKSYYKKFRAILSPTQIQKMYDAERALNGLK